MPLDSGGIGLKYLFAQPFIIYRIVSVVSNTTSTSFIKDINIGTDGGQGYISTRKTIIDSGLPDRKSIGFIMFPKAN